MDEALAAAEDIVAELLSRGGFNAWWCEIDDAMQVDIMIAVADIIEEHAHAR